MRYVALRSSWVVLFLAVACPSFAESDSLVLRIDRTSYSHRQLFGVSQKQLRKRFESAVENYSNRQLENALAATGHLLTNPELAKTITTRVGWKNALYDYEYHRLLDQATGHLILAHISKRIFKRHGTKAADYFDLKTLREAFSRQVGLIEFLYANQKAPPAENDRLFNEAAKRYGLSVSRKHWKVMRTDVRSRGSYTKWFAETMKRSKDAGDYYVEAILANYLLKNACEKGVFLEKAKRLLQFNTSTLQRILVSDYSGSAEVLRDFFHQVVDKEGDVTLGGIKELVEWFRELDARPSVTVKVQIGGMRSHGRRIPSVGVLSQLSPATYEMLGWMQKRKKEGGSVNEQKANAVFWRNYAYTIGASGYLPEIRSYIEGWEPNLALLAEAVSVDGRNLVLSEVRVGDFIKEPYPAKFFADYENNRKALEEIIVRAAIVCITEDRKEAGKLIAEIREKGKASATDSVRNTYMAVAERLAEKLKLQMK